MRYCCRRILVPAAVTAMVVAASIDCLKSYAVEAPDYQRDVKPILARKCYSCHSALKQSGGLRLDTRAVMFQGGESGPAVVAGRSNASVLIAAVRGSGDVERMPLEGDPLKAAEIELMERWIAAGAQGPDEPLPPDPHKHWSFQPLSRPAVPAVSRAAWVRNPIDAFVASEHERRGLDPQPPADSRTLLRRMYLDLIGLPPTPAEMQSFLADPSDAAYQKTVDRLLASPQYAERWARHWMDVWRYSDWDGYRAEIRESQPHIWRWRDWIIDSLDVDKSYDRMIVEMLAGDELAPDDPQVVAATGFLVRNWFKFNRNVWLEATVEHTSKAFLGLTLNCAKCHDHFFDPLSQHDYYAFRAFFEPHQIRTDRVPGQPDPAIDGLVRVYDADAKSPTFIFTRGDEAKPDQSHPISAAVPRLFHATERQIATVALPETVYYPGLREFQRSEELAKATSDLKTAEEAVIAANVKDAVDAQRKATLARLALESVEIRLAADKARIREPHDSSSADLEKRAVAAERRLSLVQAEMAFADAEHKLATAKERLVAPSVEPMAIETKTATTTSAGVEPTVKPVARTAAVDRKKLEQAVTEAEKKLAEAQKARETAAANADKTGGTYSPFGGVYPAQSTGRRLALARWIASADNPLTARVAVNHIWLRHFGEALVPSTFDFGRNGRLPSNQGLLDWLASELVASGWKMKPLHRLIVTSQAYRISSSDAGSNDPNRKIDPENTYLWRANVRRMEAEVVRDSILCVAGRLDLKRGGPDLDPATGETVGRRSLYFRHAKEKKVAFLDLYDRANVMECYRRGESVVPQQALAAANSELVLSQARLLAKELSTQVRTDTSQEAEVRFVQAAFERVLNRPPRDDELTIACNFLRTQSTMLAEPAKLTTFASGTAAGVAAATDPHQRAREDLVHVLFNHNDFVTIR